MYLLALVMLTLPAGFSFTRSLILEIARRERVNTLILFTCYSDPQPDVFRYLNANFWGSVRSFHVADRRFFDDHYRVMVTQHYRLGVVTDLRCSQVKPLLDLCSEHYYFNASFWWMTFGSDLTTSLKVLKKQNLNVDTRMTLAVSEQESDESSFELYEIFGVVHRRDGLIRAVFVGNLNDTSSNFEACSTNTYEFRKDFHGVNLLSAISTLAVPMNITLEEYLQNMDPAKRYSNDRFGYRISKLLGYHHNFTIKFILTKAWSLEVIGTNSTKGIIGQLQQNLVDISTTPLGLTTERLGSFDYTGPITPGKFVTVFRHPKNDATRNIFLQPFHNILWMAVLGILAVSAMTLLLAFCADKEIESILNGQFLIAVIAFLCQQGHSISSAMGSSRVTIITLVCFAFIIYQFYATFIIGYLLVLPPKTIKTLEQLLESNLKYSIENYAYNRDFFNRTTHEVAIKLYQKKVLPNVFGFVNVSTGIALVKRGGYAFHCDISYGSTWIRETFTDHEMCELQQMFLFPARPLHMLLPKGSPMKKLFRVTQRRFQEAGILQYYGTKFYSAKPECAENSLELVQVGFWDTTSLYMLLGVGYLLGLFVLFVEIVVIRLKLHLEMRSVMERYPVWLN